MNKTPVTLLEHPADIRGDRYRIAPRPPEGLREWADKILVQLGIAAKGVDVKKAMQEVMRHDTTNRIAHDAAWLKAHSVAGLDVIGQFPPKYRAKLRKLWAYAFHAGARHESITVNVRYLKAVQTQSAIRAALPRATQARQAKHPPKITMAKYAAAIAKYPSPGSLKKVVAGELGVSPQAVRDFERKHRDEIAKLGT